MNVSSSALQQAGTILTQAISIATQGANAGSDTTGLAGMAAEVNGMIGQMLDLANSQNPTGQYVFGGTATESPPFVVDSKNSQGLPQSISYAGSNETSNTAVSQQQSIATLLPGSQIFQTSQREATVYSGNTGAAAGSGTDRRYRQGHSFL